MAKYILVILLFFNSIPSNIAKDTSHTFHREYIEKILTSQSQDSLFNHSIQPIISTTECVNAQYSIEHIRVNNTYSPIYLMVLLMLALLICIKYFYAEFYDIVVSSALSTKAYFQNLHLKKVLPFVPNMLLYITRIIGTSIIVDVLFSVLIPKEHFLLRQVIVVVMTAMIIQNILELIFNRLVGEDDTYVIHFYQKQMIQVIALVLSVPAVLFIVKNDNNYPIFFIYYIAILLILQYILLSWRWMIILKIQKPYQLLYYFIYFCSLKLIPVLILVRWVYNFRY